MTNEQTQTPDMLIGTLFHRLFELHNKKVEESLSRIGLNYSQYAVLSAVHCLYERHNDVTQVMITEFTKLDKSVVSTTIKRLAEKGMITRHENKSDSRAKSVRLSDDGESYFRLGFDIVRQTDKTFFGDDHAEGGELYDKMLRLLRRNEAIDMAEDDDDETSEGGDGRQ